MGKNAGSGLGLTFCRKVMDAHHGYIWVESVVDKGSTFFLLLPLE
jgi:signal transduction histidine kinase